MLTSTLAFQKEQKLKCECQVSRGGAASRRAHACRVSHVTPVTDGVPSVPPQALLQVAKNLFTHLGRCTPQGAPTARVADGPPHAQPRGTWGDLVP